MRVRNFAGSLSIEDKSQCFMLCHVLLYVDRLLAHYPNLDYEILETIHWLLGPEIVEEDVLPLVSMLNHRARKRFLESEIDEEIHDARDFAHVMYQALLKTSRNEQIAIIDLLRDLLKKKKGWINSNTLERRISRRIWTHFRRCLIQTRWKKRFVYCFFCSQYMKRSKTFFNTISDATVFPVGIISQPS
jgi:hypothetical protein